MELELALAAYCPMEDAAASLHIVVTVPHRLTRLGGSDTHDMDCLEGGRL